MAEADPFDLKSTQILDDIYNAVSVFTADGFDALEETAKRHYASSPQVLPYIAPGMDALYGRVQESVREALERFEFAARRGALAVPQALIADLQRPNEPHVEVTEEMERRADAELETLRAQLAAARGASRQMRAEIVQLDRELRVCSEAADLERLAESAAAAGAAGAAPGGLASDAAAIAQAAGRLRPLLARAVRLREGGGEAVGGGAVGGAGEALGIAGLEAELRRQMAAAGGATSDTLEKAGLSLPM